MATTSENDEDVCKAVAWLGNEDVAVSSDACIYKHSLNPKYVSYFFQAEQFHSQKGPYITGAKVRRVNTSNLAKILIPILPKMSPLNPEYLSKKHSVFQKIAAFVEKFKGVGGQL